MTILRRIGSGRVAVIALAVVAAVVVALTAGRNLAVRRRTPVPPARAAKPASADAALRCFLRARVAGSLADALPCVTGRLASEHTDAATFTDPAIERFTILRDVSVSGQRLRVDVRAYTPAWWSDDRFTVVRSSDGWLVHTWAHGRPTALSEASTVSVPFPTAPCGEGHEFATVTRRVPREADVREEALRELFTGPWPGEAAASPAVRPGSRVLSVEVRSGAAVVDVNRTTALTGGACGFALGVDAIERTLAQFGDVRDVRVTVDGRRVAAHGGAQGAIPSADRGSRSEGL